MIITGFFVTLFIIYVLAGVIAPFLDSSELRNTDETNLNPQK
ncbi:MAG: hypothetical protein WD552_00675 [Candidatus Paceibacterota bacterium]